MPKVMQSHRDSRSVLKLMWSGPAWALPSTHILAETSTNNKACLRTSQNYPGRESRRTESILLSRCPKVKLPIIPGEKQNAFRSHLLSLGKMDTKHLRPTDFVSQCHPQETKTFGFSEIFTNKQGTLPGGWEHTGSTDAAHEGYRPLVFKAAGEKEWLRIPL